MMKKEAIISNEKDEVNSTFFRRYALLHEVYNEGEGRCPKCKENDVCDGCLVKMNSTIAKDHLEKINMPKIILESHFISKIGSLPRDLPQLTYISTVVGVLKIRDLVSLICSTISDFSEILDQKLCWNDYIKKFVNIVDDNSWISLVGSLKNGSSRLKTDVRVSKTIDFGPEAVSIIGDFMMPQIKKELDRNPIPYEDVYFEPSHGNIIYYTKGGKFELHRDAYINGMEQTKKNNRNKFSIMYTLLVCLSCNLDNKFESDEGNTIVYLPTHNWTILRHKNYQFATKPHIFSQSCVPGQWVLFPSQARHASIKIKTDNKHKCILKMDLHITYKYDRYDNPNTFLSSIVDSMELSPDAPFVKPFKLQNRFMSSIFCNCKLCDQSERLYMNYSYFINKKCEDLIGKILNQDCLHLILDFAMDYSHRNICNFDESNPPTVCKEDNKFGYLDFVTECFCRLCLYKSRLNNSSSFSYKYETKKDDYYHPYRKRAFMTKKEKDEYNKLYSKYYYDSDEYSDCNGD